MVVCYTMISSQIEEPIAEVVELVDTPSGGGGGASRAGSSPAFGTIRCFMHCLDRVGLGLIMDTVIRLTKSKTKPRIRGSGKPTRSLCLISIFLS